MPQEFTIRIPKPVASIVNSVDKKARSWAALSGVHVEADADNVTMVATDSRHLVALTWPTHEDDNVLHATERGPATVQPDAIKGAAGGALTVNGRAQSKHGKTGAVLDTELVEGRFPAWRDVIPSETEDDYVHGCHLTLDVDVLTAMLKTLKDVSETDGKRKIVLTIPRDNPSSGRVERPVLVTAHNCDDIAVQAVIMPLA